jgi:hypothetical protein
MIKELISSMSNQAAHAKDQILRKAIGKKLGKEEITSEDIKQIEMIKQGDKEWLMHEDKTFGFLTWKFGHDLNAALSAKSFQYTVFFNECNNEHLDKMVADQKYEALKKRMAEEMRQANLWSAAIKACQEIGITTFGNGAVNRLRELGFTLEMKGVNNE